ncbi:hypothetical protein BDR05DRAFT_952051 [Suillus weaverae]|nr:hypothetical protein BDR05DRAFT_952051 [Suillus weaverae]
MSKMWEDIHQGKQYHLPPQPASNVEPQEEPGMSTHRFPQLGDNDQVHANFDGNFNFIDDDFGVAGESLEEKYEGARTCYSQDGLTFLDLFDANEYVECRKENLFYPFASKEEWEVGDFLLHSSLSMTVINKFQKLLMIQKLCLSFSNARELRSQVEMLPSGPNWKCQVYSEWLMGNTAWEMQTQFPRGGTVLGTMLSSNKTNITTMTAYIIDTPEAAMLACVHGKTSLFTMAFYLQFSNSFRHPTHTCSIILDQLNNITIDPNELEVYFNACTEYWLNAVVGAQELDFKFSILQPIMGYHHFAGGISKLKQVTGRVHCDIQCYIVGLISGVAPCQFVIAICALMDVQYLAQCPAPIDDFLACIDQSLLTFHENKDVIMALGVQMGTKKPIDNWFIPKLELLRVSLPVHAKLVLSFSEIKEPARHTNNNDYDPQICWHLD